QLPSASHAIQDLSANIVGQNVVLHGYLGPRADLSKKLSFVPLISQDLKHSIQIISTSKTSQDVHSLLTSLTINTPVVVHGTVKNRKPPKDEQHEIQRITDVEIELSSIHVLNRFPQDLIIPEDAEYPPEQRHLQIRMSHELRKALRFRSQAVKICRAELERDQGFVEVETPLLFKSTPEGAREFLVPTRTKGLAYALPQSPQQYKQILMASGIPRYYQIARCFRDEDLRADRQPEFTQLDIEMAFATGEQVMACIEKLLRRLWLEQLQVSDLPSAFPRMTYQEAMAKYGVDKPDLRLGMEISRIEYMLPVDLVSKVGPLTDPAVEVMKLRVSDDPKHTRNFVNTFMDSPEAVPFLENPEGQPGIFIYDPRR
ncbi:hypothetical protein LTS18_012352, partial [Coniosporium uncinatum]